MSDEDGAAETARELAAALARDADDKQNAADEVSASSDLLFTNF
jgi:hypothetical protein